MTDNKIQKEFFYPDLSYQIIGIAYSISNSLGFGHLEKTYCNAFEEYLKQSSILYKREFYYPIKVFEKTIAKEFFDFLIDDKIIIEIKTGLQNYRGTCTQIFRYLKSSEYKLGIIIRFTRDGVRIKRIPKFY